VSQSERPRSVPRADYGIDAPDVVQNLALVGAAGLSIDVVVSKAAIHNLY
jgi:hypothetical protein